MTVSLARLPGADADVLLPAGCSFADYVAALDARAIFPKLSLATAAEVVSLSDEAPRVGIPIADPASLLPHADEDIALLVALVRSMGCTPLLIPPCADVVQADAAAALVGAVHGLLGPGGDDVDPRIYREARRPETAPTNYVRDRFEADVALAARDAPVFMFGICRSHQLWNAAFGGTLVQDVRGEGRAATGQDQIALGMPLSQPFVVYWPDGRVRFENRVYVTPGSDLAAIVGQPSLLTNSYHHQAVDTVGPGVSVCGVVRDSETGFETIEATEARNMISTQFHPEAMQSDPLERSLFTVLGRRARIFWLAEQGGDVRQAMERCGPNVFTAADWQWLERGKGCGGNWD